MFGSSPFGQTSSPFGSQPTFGQNTNAGNNPFATKPFGATSPFGAQSGGSFFGNTSTGVFGSQNSSPVGSTSVFGASSTPAFGTPTPTFGSSSPSPTFGSTSAFGQKPAFGTAPTSSFGGGSFQQPQPAFGSNLFNAGSQPAFGTPSTPTFGSSSNPAFGASTSAPAFGSTTSPTFGGTTSAFGVTSSPMFGSTTSAFGAPTPGFGAASSSGFGAASSSAFGTTNTNAFGSSSTPAFSFSSSPSFGQSASPFGAQSSPAFGQSTSPFGAQSSPAFGQSTSPFGAQSSPAFGQSTSPFGAQSSPFGAQATTPSFGSTAFGAGSQQGGSRVVPYAPTPELDSGNQPAGKLESISAMQVYKEKSHEELRWEDYQRGDKGGPAPTAQTTPGLTGFGPSTPTFGQSSSNPFSTTTQASPFATQNQAFSGSGFSVSSTPAFNSSPFGSSTTTNPFGSTPSQTPTLFNSTPSFGPTNSSSQFGQSTSIFGSSAQGTTPGFSSLNFGNTQPSPLFQSTTPTLGQTSSAFGQTPNSSTFGQNSSTFGQNSSTLGQSATGFGFNTPSTGGFGGSMFSSTPSLGFGQTPTMSMPFPSAQAPQSAGSFGFGNFGQTASAVSTGFGGGGTSLFAQNTFSQPSTLQTSVVSQPAPANPFGTLPVLPQMSFGRAGNSPSIQYGISSLPVVDKPAPVRISSILTSRHISQRRIRMPVRRSHTQPDGHRVPFFNDDEETPNTPKADALFIPRENPRALVIRPVEQQRSQMSVGKTLPSKLIPGVTQENGRSPEAVSAPINGYSIKDKDKEENGFDERTQAVKQTQKSNGTPESYSITLTGHRAGEAAIAYEHGPEIEALMPKLRNSDYYTEPRIQELAAKERIENGYCQRVKNFIIGRHGYGSIKFIGETDVRGLDLESLVQFNNREVTVYMDESKKPPIGQGLNKRAEVTLLNIKCSDKKTGQHYTAGPRIEKYKEMLKRKAEDQGAEFVSYDPVKGEWKFRVEHFSRYSLREEDDD